MTENETVIVCFLFTILGVFVLFLFLAVFTLKQRIDALEQERGK